MADLALTDSVDAPKTLFQAIGIPRQVVIDHQVGTLQVNAFTCCIGGNQHLHIFVLRKQLLRLTTILATRRGVVKTGAVE